MSVYHEDMHYSTLLHICVQRIPRRRVLRMATQIAAGALAVACGNTSAAPDDTSRTAVSLTVSASPSAAPPFDGREYGTVGVFDMDWLTEPGYTRMLDHFAASPGAFAGVRFFGALSGGTRERTEPTSGGALWVDPRTPPDFAPVLDALYALTARGLVPFVQLSFFPPAVSPAPIMPPASYEGWQLLVRTFLDAVAQDARFGREAMRGWWFEVWNEPNIAVFWGGTFDDYLALYRATSDAVRASGYAVRLGGPTLAYLPASDGERAGAPLMHRFLRFLHDATDVQCDFLSFHQKGSWIADGGEPDLDALTRAATDVADAARALVPERCHDLAIINNEADERIGFDRPYDVRADYRYAAWLAGVAVAYDTLNQRYVGTGLRFLAAADNANLHLVRAPFDGRRSLLTRTTRTATTDLLKVPAYSWYELLRLLHGRRGVVGAGNTMLYPATDLLHLTTVCADGIGMLLAMYPHAPGTVPDTRAMDVTISDIPWARVNIVRFLIDAAHSNGFAAAGGQLAPPDLAPDDARRIRAAQEIGVAAPLAFDVSLPDGVYRTSFTLDPYATTLLWLTPSVPEPPAAPAWATAAEEDGNVIVRWEPHDAASFLTYTVTRVHDNEREDDIAPVPLRAALWVDTAPPPGRYAYRIRVVSASGVTGATTETGRVIVG